MLDLKFIRENPEVVKKGVESKNEKNRVDEILALDTKRRDIIVKVEELKAKKNKVSQEVGRLKKAGENADAIIAEMKQVGDDIKELDDKLNVVDGELNDILMWIPNLPHESVPFGKSSADNVESKKWYPADYKEKDFKPLDHLELGVKHNILDFERGAKISGSGSIVHCQLL